MIQGRPHRSAGGPIENRGFRFFAGGNAARLCKPLRMTDSQIVGEIAAQHALLLELANQQRHTRAAVSALAELMISQAPGTADVNLRQAFEDRCAEIHKQLKKESIETLSRLSREVAAQLRAGK